MLLLLLFSFVEEVTSIGLDDDDDDDEEYSIDERKGDFGFIFLSINNHNDNNNKRIESLLERIDGLPLGTLMKRSNDAIHHTGP